MSTQITLKESPTCLDSGMRLKARLERAFQSGTAETLSLPRLELEAALLLAQLYDSVKTALKGRIRQVHLWSDSTIVLGWIKMQPHVLKTFVANRVAKIQELTASEATWRHVPSEENPAELLSRGVAVQELEISDLWWHGPNWIKRDDRCPEHMQEPSESLPEVKAPAITLFTTQVTPSFPLLLKHESFGKICRIIAYCFRFVDAARRSADESKPNKQQYMARSIGIEEMNRAEKVILKQTQREGFPLELRSLASNQDLPRKNKLKSLSPFIDDNGLIRIGGRLRHARLSEEQKHPIVLPARHRLALLIMREEHIRMLHCPSEQLLHSVRQRYWPIHGRRLAQKIVRTCVKCFRYNPRIPDITMGDLPRERVIMPTRPFMVRGVDYAGPFQLRESRRRGRLHVSKGYVALFICFSTKAVHLEVVTSLTRASRELQEIQEFLEKTEPEIKSFMIKQRINWSFIPPRSPHFGGIWESAVKLMKRHMYTISQGKVLTYEEFNTLVTEIEAVLNSRPLTPLTSDPSDFNVLTPSHFLIGDSLTQPVQHCLLNVPDNRLSHWQHLQKLRQQLWQREYLQELQRRSKWFVSDANVGVNTLVLLIEDNAPPFKWPLGRVVAVHPGADAKVRVVTVKTSTGSYKRAVK
ncbi:uncharacterized protein LOC120359326 [Solenopsis invicta]|uniref:uncharacterized protein LOC120359326 n=1 Tax=Solenopsis invicta TaxID=13686 RepID=UPI00193E1107|nr:uncharacterized protein LOC120359326 [Solenopsis invicta]